MGRMLLYRSTPSEASNDHGLGAPAGVGMDARRGALAVAEAPAGPAASGPGPQTPIWEPTAAAPGALTTSALLGRAAAPRALRGHLEDALVAALTRPLPPGATIQHGNALREREIAALLDHLEPVEALELGRRLDLQRPDDRLAQAFLRLTAERRGRLRAYLANTGRRAARLCA